MKWIKLFEEYSDATRVEKANVIFLTLQIMKELNAMELKKVEKNHYIYFYNGAKGEEKVKFVFNRGTAFLPKHELLSPNTIPKKLTSKFSSRNYVDSFIEKTFLKCLHDFFVSNKYLTEPFWTRVSGLEFLDSIVVDLTDKPLPSRSKPLPGVEHQTI